MSNPLLSRIRKNSLDKGFQGRAAETQVVKRLGGRAQPGSGALAGAKGDVKFTLNGHHFLGENKSTTTQSFSIKREQFLKIYQEALELSRTPVLSFQFVGPSGNSEKKDRWVAIPEHLFQELIGG